MKNIIYLFIASIIIPMNSSWAHRSGCHRWHSCPSDTGSYVCGDLGHPCRYGTTSTIPAPTAVVTAPKVNINTTAESENIADFEGAQVISNEESSLNESTPMEEVALPEVVRSTLPEIKSVATSTPTEALKLAPVIIAKEATQEKVQEKIQEQVYEEKPIRLKPTFENIIATAPEVPKNKTQENTSVNISAILKNHAKDFHSCYQTELKTTPNPTSLQGKIIIKIIVDAKGTLENTKILSKEIKSRKLGKCFKSVIDGIHFPASGKAVEVSQLINLTARRK